MLAQGSAKANRQIEYGTAAASSAAAAVLTTGKTHAFCCEVRFGHSMRRTDRLTYITRRATVDWPIDLFSSEDTTH